MSRIGKKPIPIPEGVTIRIAPDSITVKGPKGELGEKIHPGLKVEEKDRVIIISANREGKKTSALWGLTRSLVANMVEGVERGFVKKLEFEGIGYRAAVEGDTLSLQLGFSHPVKFRAPTGISFSVEKNAITVSGFDKELVGATAARVRSLKPPEPYKGKGIRYQGETIRRKAGKKAVAAG